MLTILKAHERGRADHGWLKANHSFSFGQYYNPEYMGYRSLRVMNEDYIAPDTGFPSHPHDNMEILTYVIEGSLEHRDSMGNSTIIRAGDFQKMSAGTGIQHSEMNPSKDVVTHLYQIWIEPDTLNVEPMHAELSPDIAEDETAWHSIMSPVVNESAFHVHQDARISLGVMKKGTELKQVLNPIRHYWVQVLEGSLTLNGESLSASDGASLDAESFLGIKASEKSKVLLFDLA